MSPDDATAASAPPTPIPNSYWVEPGRLLAGEYPGSSSRAEAMERIQRLLRAGVNSFIDLTEAGELPPYAALLPNTAHPVVEHHRLSMADHGVPDSLQAMTVILDTIDNALAAGRCVYVHCRAGIGRTGMTIGCYLIRGGLAPEAALDHLQVLWQQCARARSWPSIPETDEQLEFVSHWRDRVSGPPGQRIELVERCEGALIGLALGDAIGRLLADAQFDAAALTQPGAWAGIKLNTGADTATMQAVAASLLAQGRHDAEDQMQRYLQWTRGGIDVAAVPAELKRALGVWQWSRKVNAGTHDPGNLDAHSLSRSLAVALYLRRDPVAAIDLAADVSRTTQQSPVVLDACRVWTALLIDALSGAARTDLLSLQQGEAMQIVRSRKLRQELKTLLNRTWASLAQESGAIALLARALLALQNTQGFLEGLLATAPSDPSTAGISGTSTASALYGALAGAHYGSAAIAESLQRALPEAPGLRSLARRFAER